MPKPEPMPYGFHIIDGKIVPVSRGEHKLLDFERRYRLAAAQERIMAPDIPVGGICGMIFEILDELNAEREAELTGRELDNALDSEQKRIKDQIVNVNLTVGELERIWGLLDANPDDSNPYDTKAWKSIDTALGSVKR